MDFLLSAKGGDVTSWRAAESFAAAYRQALLDRAALDRSSDAEAVFFRNLDAVETLAKSHRTLMTKLDKLLEEGAAHPPAGRLKELAVEYYDLLYRHMDAFHSAPAFYQKSMAFLEMLSAVVMNRSAEQFGPLGGHLPKMALVAVGPAGRREYSPYCQLQLLLVHDEVDSSQLQMINLFCHSLHAGFQAAGLAIDPMVTPRNPEWRGSVSEWRQRIDNGLRQPTADGLIAVLRLTDQYPLTNAAEIARELKEMTFATLGKSRPAQANLIERMESLSTGLGMMGKLKLERSGAGRGLFRLLDHGLLPLSAALSALALIKESRAVGSCDRVLDLLERRELDVDLAEKMLKTWHSLHELRLGREWAFSFLDYTEQNLLLNPDQLSAKQLHSLKTALTSVTAVQRHVGIVFSGMGA